MLRKITYIKKYIMSDDNSNDNVGEKKKMKSLSEVAAALMIQKHL